MFDIGWSEMMLILVLTIIVVGPRDLPRVMRTMGHWTRKVRGLAREFQDGINRMAVETEIDSLKKDVNDIASGAGIDDFTVGYEDPIERIDSARQAEKDSGGGPEEPDDTERLSDDAATTGERET